MKSIPIMIFLFTVTTTFIVDFDHYVRTKADS